MVISAVVTRPFYNASKFFVFSVMFVASMIAGSHLYAQGDPNGNKSVPPPEMKERTPDDMADHMSTMLTDKLGLNDNQKKSVYDIVLAYASSHDRQDFDPKELDSKIDEVLTLDQKDKFKEFIKNGTKRNAPPSEGNDDAPGINK